MPYIYLGSPYSHPERAVRQARYIAARAYAAQLFNKGLVVFSPITHCHPMHEAHDMPGDWRFWSKVDTTFLRPAGGMYVLQLPGWEDSIGLSEEIELALKLHLPLEYHSPLLEGLVDAETLQKLVSVVSSTD